MVAVVVYDDVVVVAVVIVFVLVLAFVIVLVLSSARSEEHTSELQSRPHISYAVFCLKKKNKSSTIVNVSQN